MKLQRRFANMKKARIIAVIAALIVSLSGCANTDHPQTIQDSSGIEAVTSEVYERTEPEDRSSTSVSESKESTAESTDAVKAETESAQAENPQPAAEQSPTPGTQPPQTIIPNEPPKTVEPTPESKPSPTQPPPPAEEKSTPEPALTEPPQEIAPAPEEPAVPEFNIQTWIDYAKAYAVNAGLRLENSAVDCWDNPITAGAYSACLERDIQSRLDRYSRDEDITDVWIWAEKRSDGSYDLYIGYA